MLSKCLPFTVSIGAFSLQKQYIKNIQHQFFFHHLNIREQTNNVGKRKSLLFFSPTFSRTFLLCSKTHFVELPKKCVHICLLIIPSLEKLLYLLYFFLLPEKRKHTAVFIRFFFLSVRFFPFSISSKKNNNNTLCPYISVCSVCTDNARMALFRLREKRIVFYTAAFQPSRCFLLVHLSQVAARARQGKTEKKRLGEY